MNSEQHKEHIINVIERIKQQNIIIEKKLQELSIFYITNKDKYDYELVKTYFNNLKKFIISNLYLCYKNFFKFYYKIYNKISKFL